MSEYWYRYEDRLYSLGVDESGDPLPGSEVRVFILRYEVMKHTPKGVWLRDGPLRRFVLNDSRKRFACSTEDEALVSFLARKRKQAAIYRARADKADRAAKIAQYPSYRHDYVTCEELRGTLL